MLGALGAGFALVQTGSAPPVPTPPVLTPAAMPVPMPARAIPTPALRPSFDIVRIAPDGHAVLAGRAEPGQDIVVMQGGTSLGSTRADASGAWTLIPDTPLPPGPAELSLLGHGPAGAVVAGNATVLLVVPSRDAPAAASAPVPPAAAASALAVLAPVAGPSRLLQAPAAGTPGKLGLDTVDYDDSGAIRFSGSAAPGAPLRLYVDATPLGDATADASGHWALSPPQSLRPGVHRLRLDQLALNGRVASRVELPFLRETLALSQVAPGEVVVQPGQNLWRLARRAYGSGIRYTVIYQANREQIRDPRLIYAGQVFNMPEQ